MADDDPDQLVVTKALLESLGLEVVVAECPSEALRELERSAPGLFLMDLRFPNAAGQPDSREGMALIRSILPGSESGCAQRSQCAKWGHTANLDASGSE